MPDKEQLMEKLFRKQMPKNFTIQELDLLMRKCDCVKSSGGRGSAVKYYHPETGRILQFDLPHPRKELYSYQIKMVRDFMYKIGEKEEKQ